jgi:AraC family transcriptional regulator
MKPQFVTKPAFTVVGMLIHTKPMTQEIPNLWQQFGPRMGEIQHLAEPGVSYGLMDHFDQEMSKLDYMAGNAVEKVVDLPPGMTHWNVPANTYAVFEATLPTISDTFGYIYNTWLPTSGYQQAAGPYFERYGETFNPHDPTSTLSIYIPVEKKRE